MIRIKICGTCNLEKPISDFQKQGFHKKADGSKTQLYRPSCKLCANAHYKERFNFILENCGVEFKCVCCGYEKCKEALEFHHPDPSVKENHISSMWTYSEEKILEEINKCLIVCANCHREIHAGIRNIQC